MLAAGNLGRAAGGACQGVSCSWDADCARENKK